MQYHEWCTSRPIIEDQSYFNFKIESYTVYFMYCSTYCLILIALCAQLIVQNVKPLLIYVSVRSNKKKQQKMMILSKSSYCQYYCQ